MNNIEAYLSVTSKAFQNNIISDVKTGVSTSIDQSNAKRVGQRSPLFTMCLYGALLGHDLKKLDSNRTGIILGSSLSGNDFLLEQFIKFKEKGAKRISPLFIPKTLHNSAASYLAIAFGFQGVSSGVNCMETSGVESISESINYMLAGQCDTMFCGGGENSLKEKGSAKGVLIKLSLKESELSKRVRIKTCSLGYGWLNAQDSLGAFVRDHELKLSNKTIVFGHEHLKVDLPFSVVQDGSCLPPLEKIHDHYLESENLTMLTVSSESHVHFLEIEFV